MSDDPLRGLPLAIATGAVLLLAAAGAETSDFLPQGERALLLELAGPAPSQWRDPVRQERSRALPPRRCTASWPAAEGDA
jgi:hypothetical protein